MKRVWGTWTFTPLAILYNFSNGIRKNKKFRSFSILCLMEPITGSGSKLRRK
ncbi:hypothetical protein [Enterococcus mundtii]|uniref:hypothetical protein n=1 Tax=Enterococcus mundtii TaxID=53346 RepID=UPI0019663C97|nr:hypothetical protein [Enterococcus mundtii]